MESATQTSDSLVKKKYNSRRNHPYKKVVIPYIPKSIIPGLESSAIYVPTPRIIDNSGRIINSFSSQQFIHDPYIPEHVTTGPHNDKTYIPTPIDILYQHKFQEMKFWMAREMDKDHLSESNQAIRDTEGTRKRKREESPAFARTRLCQ